MKAWRLVLKKVSAIFLIRSYSVNWFSLFSLLLSGSYSIMFLDAKPVFQWVPHVYLKLARYLNSFIIFTSRKISQYIMEGSYNLKVVLWNLLFKLSIFGSPHQFTFESQWIKYRIFLSYSWIKKKKKKSVFNISCGLGYQVAYRLNF